jgi:hypothetical protein
MENGRYFRRKTYFWFVSALNIKEDVQAGRHKKTRVVITQVFLCRKTDQFTSNAFLTAIIQLLL